MNDERKQPMGLWQTTMMLRTAATGGTNMVAAAVPLLLGNAALMIVRLSFPSPEPLVHAGQLMLLACAGTAFVASRRAHALAFMRVLPAIHTPRSLILVPVFVIGLALALLALLYVPLLSALTFLGWWCWAASIGLRFAYGGGWALLLVATPLVFLGPAVAAAIASSFAGGAALTLSSLILGLLGYVTSRRNLSRDIISASRPHGRTRRGAFVKTYLSRHIRLGTFWTSLRLFGLLMQPASTFGPARWVEVWMLVFLAACTVVAWFYPLDNPTLTWLAAVTASNCLAGAHVRARIEFLATRPLVLSRLRVALVVSWALVAVLLPTIGLVSATTVTTIQGDDLRKLPYAAAIITAAALPDASDLIGGSASPPAGNGRAFRGDTPIFITSALRALMLRYLACMALLQCMSFGLLTASSVASARKSGKWRHWVYIAASLMVPVLVLLNSVKRIGSPSLEQSTRLPFPPLWVAALLAIFGLWEMRRSLRLPLRA